MCSGIMLEYSELVASYSRPIHLRTLLLASRRHQPASTLITHTPCSVLMYILICDRRVTHLRTMYSHRRSSKSVDKRIERQFGRIIETNVLCLLYKSNRDNGEDKSSSNAKYSILIILTGTVERQ